MCGRISSASCKVPPECEYEEYPRGRVIAQIKGALHLPAKTKVGSDPHYRCFACLYGKDEDDEE
jgi:hypothetical protein